MCFANNGILYIFTECISLYLCRSRSLSLFVPNYKFISHRKIFIANLWNVPHSWFCLRREKPLLWTTIVSILAVVRLAQLSFYFLYFSCLYSYLIRAAWAPNCDSLCFFFFFAVFFWWLLLFSFAVYFFFFIFFFCKQNYCCSHVTTITWVHLRLGLRYSNLDSWLLLL